MIFMQSGKMSNPKCFRFVAKLQPTRPCVSARRELQPTICYLFRLPTQPLIPGVRLLQPVFGQKLNSVPYPPLELLTYPPVSFPINCRPACGA